MPRRSWPKWQRWCGAVPDDLRSYLEDARRAGSLYVVGRRVSPRYEIAAVTARADGSNALLFEDVDGSPMRVATNVVGTRERFAMAIGCGEDGIHGAVAEAAAEAAAAAASASSHSASAPGPAAAAAGGPAEGQAPFLQNSSTDLSPLPIVTHFEKEPGPFITSSIVQARSLETGAQNSSFHRMMPIDPTHMSVRMVEGRHLHRCYCEARDRGEDLPVAVAVGVHPSFSIAGAYQAAWGESEKDIAGALAGGRLALARCPSTGLLVPAEAEVVMEGRILADRTHREWMVEMLQTYDHARDQPVFELERLHYRDRAVYHDVLAGYSEHRLLMGMPAESRVDGELKARFGPLVRAARLTGGGCNWLHAVVQISKRADGDAAAVIGAAFDAHRSLKQVTVVDDDIDPSSAEAVEYAMATRFQADRDLTVVRDVRGSSLDPSSDQARLRTAKLGIDATRPLAKRAEGFEIARIPGADAVLLADYVAGGAAGDGGV